jgi:hypothetical protein
MGLFDKVFRKKETMPPPVEVETVAVPEEPKAPKARRSKSKPKEPVVAVSTTEKDKATATAAGEPWVSVIGVEIDPDNVGNGAFELDWNEIFLAKLVRAGYKGKTDQQIVDLWFQEICRNVLTEAFEQEQADPDARYVNKTKLDSNRSEYR